MGKWWAIGGGALLAALLVGSVALALLREREATFAPGTPEAAAQALLRAAVEDDFGAAYSLLSQDLQAECSLERFAENDYRYFERDFQARLESARVVGDTTFVNVEITEFYGGGFYYGSGGWTHQNRYTLLQEGGEWKFKSYPWPYQNCEYLPEPEPVPTPTPEPTPTPAAQ